MSETIRCWVYDLLIAGFGDFYPAGHFRPFGNGGQSNCLLDIRPWMSDEEFNYPAFTYVKFDSAVLEKIIIVRNIEEFELKVSELEREYASKNKVDVQKIFDRRIEGG